MEGKTNRKIRSDKKISVKPLVSMELYECMSRISYISNQSIRIISEKICLEGLSNIQVIDNLYNRYGFRRDFYFSEYLVKIGDSKFGEKRTVSIRGDKKRLSMAFTQKDYERLFDLSHAMGKTPASTTSLLIESSVKHTTILHKFLSEYLKENIDPQRRKQLKLTLKYVNKHNPYKEDISMLQLLSMIVEEFLEVGKSSSIKESIDTFLNDFLKD